jgi:DNA-binding transcriptional LysR family regulator
MFVIDAALQGRGIALVWLFAASRMLTDGQLVRASRESVTSTNGFHAVWRKSRDNDGINRRIATLLAQESAAGGRA